MTFSILDIILSALRKLFVKNWYNNPNNIFIDHIGNGYFETLVGFNTDRVPINDNNQYILVTNMQSTTNLKEQITWGNNIELLVMSMVIYKFVHYDLSDELKGGVHYYAHTYSLDNNRKHRYFSQ